MPAGLGMPAAVAAHAPTADDAGACALAARCRSRRLHGRVRAHRLPGRAELVPLHHRPGADARAAAVRRRAASTVPACYIAGAADWGIYQSPGAFERMQREVCTRMARRAPAARRRALGAAGAAGAGDLAAAGVPAALARGSLSRTVHSRARQPPRDPEKARQPRKTAPGRPLPAVDVGCLGAQIGGRRSGGDFDGVAVAGRPTAVGGAVEMLAAKPTSGIVPWHPQVHGLGDLYAVRTRARSAAVVPLSQPSMPIRMPRPWSGMQGVEAAAYSPLK